MASGTIFSPFSIGSGVIRGEPSGITASSSADDVIAKAERSVVYIWGGWGKPSYAPYSDTNRAWTFILLYGSNVGNYWHLFAICGNNASTAPTYNGIYLYNYSSSKWVKYSGTIVS